MSQRTFVDYLSLSACTFHHSTLTKKNLLNRYSSNTGLSSLQILPKRCEGIDAFTQQQRSLVKKDADLRFALKKRTRHIFIATGLSITSLHVRRRAGMTSRIGGFHMGRFSHVFHQTIVGCLLGVLFIMLTTVTTIRAGFAAACPSEAYVSIPSDPWIPDISHSCFAQGRTIIQSTTDGNWSSPSTWGGTLPTRNDVVVVRHNVTLDTQTEAYDLAIYPNGTLSFETNAHTSLTVGTLMVMEGSTLQIGTAIDPVASDASASILFADRAINTTLDPGQYGHGLLVFGTLTVHGAPLSDTFVRLDAEPESGATTLSLEKPVTGWRAGDRVILPDTRQLTRNEDGADYVPQWEAQTVQSISGATVTLNQALAYPHKGARDGDGNPVFFPHVGNLTRNVVFQSVNPAGTRGYILLAHRATVDIRYAAFRDLGRTTVMPYDETTFDADGNATQIASNQLYRTPLTIYHLLGPTPVVNSYQYRLIGNAVDGGETDHPYRWCIGIIDSHFGLIQKNVCYNTMGSGIAMWTGSETENLVEHNFVMRVKGTGAKSVTSGIKKIQGNEGSGFYLKVNNRVRDNVAANIVPLPASIIEPIKGNANVDWHGWRMGYALYQSKMKNGVLRIPAAPGTDPSEYTTVTEGLPVLEFARNEVYGAVKHGVIKDYAGLSTDANGSTLTDLLKDFRAWHFHGNGYWGQSSNPVTLEGYAAYGDKQVKRGVGVNFHVAENLNFRLTQSTIHSLDTGMIAPPAPEFRVESGQTPNHGVVHVGQSHFRNYTNISVAPVARYNNGVGLPTRAITIQDVAFQTVNASGTSYENVPQYHIEMNFQTGNYVNLLVKNEVFVANYNNTGNDFQVYYLEQRPDFIVPETTVDAKGSVKMVGAPGPGLTNQDMVNNGDSPIAGEIAPCLNDTSYLEIKGYVCNASTGEVDVTPPAPPTGFRQVLE